MAALLTVFAGLALVAALLTWARAMHTLFANDDVISGTLPVQPDEQRYHELMQEKEQLLSDLVAAKDDLQLSKLDQAAFEVLEGDLRAALRQTLKDIDALMQSKRQQAEAWLERDS